MKNKKEHPLTFFRKANEARQKLVKKSFGGPGSGMGRMASDDAAFEAMLSENKPVVKPTVDYGSGPYGNTTPGKISLKSYGRQNTTPPDTTMKSMIPNPPMPTPGSLNELPTTPGHLVSPLHWSKQKKGGSVKRKK